MNRLIADGLKLPGESAQVDDHTANLLREPRARRGGPHPGRTPGVVGATLVGLALSSTLAACGGHGATGTARPTRTAVADAEPGADPLEWQGATRSPEPAAAGDEALVDCGAPDAALARVAERLARRGAGGGAVPEAEELATMLRAEGSPHVWPRAWTLSAASLDAREVADRYRAFAEQAPPMGEARCGAARARARDGSEHLAVVRADALADLSPLPLRARTGQWLTFDATVHVPVSAAKVVVLGPSGAPRTVVTSLRDGRVRATFSADRAGAFTVQLLATTALGPRPLLEAMVFVDTEPPSSPGSAPAPGEDLASAEAPASLRAMIDAARRSEGLPALAPAPQLDALAEAHARRMRDTGLLAHDTGQGDPVERMREAGVSTPRPGENVARARSLRLAHRAIWASPSHRGNLLDPGFDSVGVGLARGADGSVWACEIFADFAHVSPGRAAPPPR